MEQRLPSQLRTLFGPAEDVIRPCEADPQTISNDGRDSCNNIPRAVKRFRPDIRAMKCFSRFIVLYCGTCEHDRRQPFHVFDRLLNIWRVEFKLTSVHDERAQRILFKKNDNSLVILTNLSYIEHVLIDDCDRIDVISRIVLDPHDPLGMDLAFSECRAMNMIFFSDKSAAIIFERENHAGYEVISIEFVGDYSHALITAHARIGRMYPNLLYLGSVSDGDAHIVITNIFLFVLNHESGEVLQHVRLDDALLALYSMNCTYANRLVCLDATFSDLRITSVSIKKENDEYVAEIERSPDGTMQRSYGNVDIYTVGGNDNWGHMMLYLRELNVFLTSEPKKVLDLQTRSFQVLVKTMPYITRELVSSGDRDAITISIANKIMNQKFGMNEPERIAGKQQNNTKSRIATEMYYIYTAVGVRIKECRTNCEDCAFCIRSYSIMVGRPMAPAPAPGEQTPSAGENDPPNSIADEFDPMREVADRLLLL